jgi:hypothetical protein
VCSVHVQRASGAMGPTYQRQISFRDGATFRDARTRYGLLDLHLTVDRLAN